MRGGAEGIPGWTLFRSDKILFGAAAPDLPLVRRSAPNTARSIAEGETRSKLLRGANPMGAGGTGRQQEIGHALVDVSQYLRRGGQVTSDGETREEPSQVPDSRHP